MGWNSWNGYFCNINSTIIKNNADQLKSLGLSDLGYKYVIIDDCWQDVNRDKNGFITPDHKKFPDGMKAVGDYIHSKMLKFGIYSSAGTKTCGKRPGSLGFETQDAGNYTMWGVDYLKYDNCYNAGVPAFDRYSAMGNALKKTGRQIFYSLCNWGNEDVATWGKTVAHSWRTT